MSQSDDKVPNNYAFDQFLMNFSSFVYMKLLPTVIVIGIIGNALILINSHFNPTKSTGFRYIWFLAVSDLGACLMVIFWPVLHVMANYYKWSFLYTYGWNAFLIYFVNVIVNVFMKASTLLTCSLTMDRYVALHLPLRYRKFSVPKMVNSAVLVSFVVPLCLMIPRVLQYRIVPMIPPPLSVSVSAPSHRTAALGSDINSTKLMDASIFKYEAWRNMDQALKNPKFMAFFGPLNSQSSRITRAERNISNRPYRKGIKTRKGKKKLNTLKLNLRDAINTSNIYDPGKAFNQNRGFNASYIYLNASTMRDEPAIDYGKKISSGATLTSKEYHFVPNLEFTSLPSHTAYQWIREISLTFAPLVLLIILNISIIQRYKVNMQKRASMINIKKAIPNKAEVSAVALTSCDTSKSSATAASDNIKLITNIKKAKNSKSLLKAEPFNNRHFLTLPRNKFLKLRSSDQNLDAATIEPFIEMDHCSNEGINLQVVRDYSEKERPTANSHCTTSLLNGQLTLDQVAAEQIQDSFHEMAKHLNDANGDTIYIKPVKGWNGIMRARRKQNPLPLLFPRKKCYNGTTTGETSKCLLTADNAPALDSSQGAHDDKTIASTSHKKTPKSNPPIRDMKAEKARKHLKDERRLTIMLITVVSLHFVCNIPQAIVTILDTKYHGTPTGSSFYFQLALISTNVLEALNFAANFYLYCVFIKDFRSQVKNIFSKLFRKPVVIPERSRSQMT